jgi:hypothetical protein
MTQFLNRIAVDFTFIQKWVSLKGLRGFGGFRRHQLEIRIHSINPINSDRTERETARGFALKRGAHRRKRSGNTHMNGAPRPLRESGVGVVPNDALYRSMCHHLYRAMQRRRCKQARYLASTGINRSSAGKCTGRFGRRVCLDRQLHPLLTRRGGILHFGFKMNWNLSVNWRRRGNFFWKNGAYMPNDARNDEFFAKRDRGCDG